MGEAIVYHVMHMEKCVAQVSTAGECKIYLEDFMPYDLVLEESDDFDTRINNVISFHSWCASRLTPRDRTYAKEILNSIGASQNVTDRERAQIALSYHCLSLLDVFWVKEENETVRFEDINLYTHSLSNALVDIALRGHQMTVTNAHLLANDLSTGGCYPKAWVRKEEGFYLYKAGGQDAVEREVLASKICRCFDCHQVLYEQGMFENEPVSISKIMTSQRYSLVTYAAYPQLVDFKQMKSSGDAFLIATAIKYGLTVITEENKKGEKKIPFVCRDLRVPCVDILGLCENEGWSF